MKKVPYYDRWPEVKSSFPQDPQTEAFVDSIVAQMTPEEKVGQMIQPDIRQVTPAECEQFKLGSVLNGGGGWVNEDKHAPVDAWLARADEYWFALERAYEGRPFRVPYMWGTDAVHGHNNIFGATIFPHNIGLGAAGDCNLIYNIARATATEIAVTGMDWTFAPTVATPRDRRWGRHYEGYSEDPTLVYNYSPEVVAGLQGTPEQLKTDQFVLSNVKHWLGDGGTNNGVDLINEQDGTRLLFDLVQQAFQALLEITTIFGARQQRTEVKRVNGRIADDIGDFTLDNQFGQAFGNCGFTNTGFPNQQRVVFTATRQDLYDTFHFRHTADKWVNTALRGLRIQVYGVFNQRTLIFFFPILTFGNRFLR